MNVYDDLLAKPYKSDVINVKLLLLTNGIDLDINSIYSLTGSKNIYKTTDISPTERHQTDNKQIPNELIISSSNFKSVVKVFYRKDSPIILKNFSNGFKLVKKSNEAIFPVNVELIENIFFVGTYAGISGLNKISIIPYDGCENWQKNKPCSFCGAKLSVENLKNDKPNIIELKEFFYENHYKWWMSWQQKYTERLKTELETISKILSNSNFHIEIMLGNLQNLNIEWQIALSSLYLINQYFDLSKIDLYLNLMPVNNLFYIKEAYRLGCKYLCFNLEYYDENLYKNLCPGKNSYLNFNDMLFVLYKSVDIFGKGRVRTNLIIDKLGYTKLHTGIKKLAANGIVPDMTIFFPRRYSILDYSNVLDADAILCLTQEAVNILFENNFQPYCCPLSSRSSITSDLYYYLLKR